MKKLKLIMFFILLFISPFTSIASDNPPDPGGNPQTGGDTPLGGGAPVGSGFFMLLGLAAAYGSRKLYNLKKEELEE